MSHADRTVNNIEPFFHPVSHYDSPDDVLNDARLSTDEKRVILSSWASDMYIVESHPALREVPGIRKKSISTNPGSVEAAGRRQRSSATWGIGHAAPSFQQA